MSCMLKTIKRKFNEWKFKEYNRGFNHGVVEGVRRQKKTNTKTHRRRAQKKRDVVISKAKYICYYCDDSPVLRGERLTIDHKTPISRGGSSKLTNLVAACLPCNNEKADMTAGEFQKYLNRK